jgi:hypothetical protein
MRIAGGILLGLALTLAGCEKPPAPAPASKVTAAKPAEPWNSRALQAMAVRSAACGSTDFSRTVQEAEALRQAPGVTRQGDVLTVGKARFENKKGDEDGIGEEVYTYLGAYGGSGLDAVMGQYYEGYSVALVDARSGAVRHFLDLPIASPDGRYFVAVSASEYDEYGLEIVERTPGGWVQRLKDNSTGMQSPCSLVWQSNDVLNLRARWTATYDGLAWSPQLDDAWGPARLVKDGETWRYEPPKRR